jgi:mono/diheme cytochrome c family protein
MLKSQAFLFAGLAVGLALSLPASVPAAEPITFEKHVRPIFKEYCIDCHGGAEKVRAGLDLRLKRFAEKGGKHGPAIVAGVPAESLLLQRLRAGEMPPGEKKVPAEKIAVVEKWIAGGARALRLEPERLPPGINISPEERAYWFFQPVRRPEIPGFSQADRVRTPVDALILARLREKGWSFAPDADRPTLIRRAAFDLTGLPPTPADIQAFVNDRSPQAYEKMIDRLLASPHYGERWARHWLDVAGYADSDGNGNDDTVRPYAYKYRDWVIRAINADMPLDQFIIEQLAGDELVPRPWKNLAPESIDKLIATGFLRMAPDGTNGGDLQLAANQVVADTLKIVGSSLFGLTVGCAQCHDHRYDPIPQADYYRLRAIFEPALDPARWRRPAQRLISLYTDADRANAAAIEAEAQKLQIQFDAKQKKFLDAAVARELAKFSEPLRGKLRAAYYTEAGKRSAEQNKLLESHPSVKITPGVLYQYNQAAADELKKDREKINACRARKPVEDFISVLDEVPGAVPVTHLFHRGDHRQPKQAVTPGDLTIAAADGQRFEIAPGNPKLSTTGRRLAWARHLVDGKHSLVGRVLVNRIWLNHFGRGIVDTPGDFGTLGLRPTHPELLDWLAGELVRQGWSLKRMHKLIMMSTVYRQSSRSSQPSADDALYARYPVRRLDAESFRDHILAAAGRLDLTLFGPPVAVAEDAVGHVVAQNDSPRRSVYLQVRRSRPESFLSAFDAPQMAVNCDRRMHSTAATQSLILMNGDFILKHAGVFAQRVKRETPPDFAQETIASFVSQAGRPLLQQIAFAWTIAYQRPITPEELSLACRFASSQLAYLRSHRISGNHEQIVLTNLCQQLLSSNEFLYVD